MKRWFVYKKNTIIGSKIGYNTKHEAIDALHKTKYYCEMYKKFNRILSKYTYNELSAADKSLYVPIKNEGQSPIYVLSNESFTNNIIKPKFKIINRSFNIVFDDDNETLSEDDKVNQLYRETIIGGFL